MMVKTPVVYVAVVGEYIKIGQTNNLRTRLRTLTFTCLKPANLRQRRAQQLWVRLGDRAAERQLHGQVKPYHVIGEWYELEALSCRNMKRALSDFTSIPMEDGRAKTDPRGAPVGHVGAGGRPRIPSHCPKCGKKCPSHREAREHCK